MKLQGGLGNQLFQYAAGRSISLANRQRLLLDVSSYRNDYLGRKCLLQHFNIAGKIVDRTWLQKLITPRTRVNRLFTGLSLVEEHTEKDFTYKGEWLTTHRPFTFYDGFWQSYKYFEEFRESLLLELTLKDHSPEALAKRLPQQGPCVAIHVRRTDYLEDDRYGFLGEEYYSTALRFLGERLENPCFMVFSDDIDWCRQHLQTGEQTHYISSASGLADYEELYLMSLCSHQVIANSSFSWWGAWLNRHPDKMVLRPARPFRDPALLYESYYPADWISVE